MTHEEKKRYLDELTEKGLLSEDDRAQAQAELDQPNIEAPSTTNFTPFTRAAPQEKQIWGMPVKTYAACLHLAVFAAYVAPILGVALPLVMWLKYRDDPIVDEHGKIVMNWVVSYCIYAAICGILVFVLIGIPMFWMLLLLSVIFSIIGAIQASEGKQWHYPASIRFFN